MNNSALSITDGMVVTFRYTMSLDDGEIVAGAAGPETITYLHGEGALLPGLEDALYGLKAGQRKAITLAPHEAYGELDEDAWELVPLSEFPPDLELEPGMALEIHDDEMDEIYEAYVAQISDEGVLLDFNHPLAGETLHFQIEVLDVRPATREELEHGHPHIGGHAH